MQDIDMDMAYPKGQWPRKTRLERLETHTGVCRVTRPFSYMLPNEKHRGNSRDAFGCAFAMACLKDNISTQVHEILA